MRPTLLHHPKFRRLCATLGLPRPHVVGCLELLWNTAYESGDPRIGDSLDVELACEWSGEEGALTSALSECGGMRGPGFVEKDTDGFYTIHDLYDHAPDYVIKRAKREAERKEKGASIEEMRSAAGRKGAAKRWQGNDKRIANGGHLLPDDSKCLTKVRTPTPTPAPTPTQEDLKNKNKSRATARSLSQTSTSELSPQPLEEALANLPMEGDRQVARFIAINWPDFSTVDAIEWVVQAKAYTSQLRTDPFEWIQEMSRSWAPSNPIYDRNGKNKLYQWLMSCVRNTVKDQAEKTEGTTKTGRALQKLIKQQRQQNDKHDIAEDNGLDIFSDPVGIRSRQV